MPRRHYTIIVLAVLALGAAGLGLVLKRGPESGLPTETKPGGKGSRTQVAPEVPKPAEATAAEPSESADAAETKASNRPEFKPAEKTAEMPATFGEEEQEETAAVVGPPKPVAAHKAPDTESDWVFVSRKDLLQARNAANEAAAITTLRSIASAQAMAETSGVIDTDRDGAGEYAYFGELSGSVPCRAASGARSYPMEPPVLSAVFGEVTRSGNVLRSGYVFRMFLPGATANKKTPGIPESPGGGCARGAPKPDGDNCEIFYAVYAWPMEAQATGARAFFLNQEGDLLVMANTDGMYSGEDKAPSFDAAFFAQSPGDMSAPAVPGARSNDGQVWSALDLADDEDHAPVELGPATEADLAMNAEPDSERVVVSRTLMRRANMSGNEARVLHTLRELWSAQAQLQAAGVIDTDGDSTGEYGYLAEMAGAVPCRAAKGSKREALEPALLSSSFGKISSAGSLLHSGYVFRIYLPGRGTGGKVPGIAEAGGGGAAKDGEMPDHDNCEVLWSVYAWPIEAGKSGARAYFMNQDGDLLSTLNADGAYSGEARAPSFDAACNARKSGDMSAALPAQGAKGNDGRRWSPLN
ncbi:MAG TPA: hypothetical protein VK843_02335 [Planctomycetota bacterium]|nr:hypothetical protein [Planctomycetota bacterium]